MQYSLDVWDYDLSLSSILTLLFRCFMPASNELGWDHSAGKSVIFTTQLSHRWRQAVAITTDDYCR
jgi:hypothetical protein